MSIFKVDSEITIDWKAVGRRVRELRGFETNQTEFSKMVGVAQSHISAVERGEKELGVLPLLRIAKHYDKTIEWILLGM